MTAALIFCGGIHLSAAAQSASSNWPSRPIRLIVPQGPGGGVDAVARVVAKELTTVLKQPVIVENKAGASGNIGAEYVAHSAPDGYTLLMGINSQFTSIPLVFPQPHFDPLTDLIPVVQTTVGGGYVLAVTNSLPVKSVKELVAYAKKNPGKLSFGSYGVGSAHHLGAELLMYRAGIQMVHVPYKQSPSIDLIAGHIQVLFDSQSSMQSLIRNGSVRALAVTSSKRVAAFPNIPTLDETFPGMVFVGWHGIWAPKGTPPAIVQKLNTQTVNILKLPEVRKRLADLTYQTTGTTPEEMKAEINQERTMWATVIKNAGITGNN